MKVTRIPLILAAVSVGGVGPASAEDGYRAAVEALGPYAHFGFDDVIVKGGQDNPSPSFDMAPDTNFNRGTAYHGYVVNTPFEAVTTDGPPLPGLDDGNTAITVGQQDGFIAYVTIGNSDPTFNNALGTFGSGMGDGVSVNFFLRLDAADLTDADTYLMGTVGKNNNTQFQIRTAPSGLEVYLKEDSTRSRLVQSNNTGVYDGQWHMVTITAGPEGGHTPQIYIDGALQETTVTSGGAGDMTGTFNNFDSDWRVGLIATSPASKSGVDELSFFLKQITQQQITELYEATTQHEPQ